MTAGVNIPDRIIARLRAMVDEMPRLVFAAISGSHMFGFPSVDSDFDIRGMHVEPPRVMLGLDKPVETRELLDGDFDFVSQEARKFLLLLFKNGNALEQLWSPLVIYSTPEHEKLKQLSLSCITHSHAAHYFGFADAQRHMFEQRKVYEVKPILYTYRIYMAGIHLLRERDVVSDINVLNQEHNLGAVEDLIAQKIKGEHVVARESQMERFRSDIDTLRAKLLEAEESNPLPAYIEQRVKDQVNDLLIEMREMSGQADRDAPRHAHEKELSKTGP